MATHWGNEGQIKIGAATVAEVTGFKLDESVTTVGDTSMGDTWKTHIPGSGIKEWSATVDCHWDETNTTGQGALVAGASLTLNLYPEGSTSGDIYYTGTATVIKRGLDVPLDGKTITRGIEFEGNGPLTEATVP